MSKYNELFQQINNSNTFGFLEKIGGIQNLKNQDDKVSSITENLNKRLNLIDSEHKGDPKDTDQALSNLNEDPELSKGLDMLSMYQAEVAQTLEKQGAYDEALRELATMPDSAKAQAVYKNLFNEAQQDYKLRKQTQDLVLGKFAIANQQEAYNELIRGKDIRKLTGLIGQDPLWQKWEATVKFGIPLDVKFDAKAFAEDMFKLSKKYSSDPNYQPAFAALTGNQLYWQISAPVDTKDKSDFGNSDFWGEENFSMVYGEQRRFTDLWNDVKHSKRPSANATVIRQAMSFLESYNPILDPENKELKKYQEMKEILDKNWNWVFGTGGKFYKNQEMLHNFVTLRSGGNTDLYFTDGLGIDVGGMTISLSELLKIDPINSEEVHNPRGDKMRLQQNELDYYMNKSQDNVLPQFQMQGSKYTINKGEGN
jgi:hypothetical protein